MVVNAEEKRRGGGQASLALKAWVSHKPPISPQLCAPQSDSHERKPWRDRPLLSLIYNIPLRAVKRPVSLPDGPSSKNHNEPASAIIASQISHASPADIAKQMASSFFRRPGVRLSVGMTKLWFAWHLFATHGFQVGPADGPSMLPTFSTFGDWIGTDKRYRLGRGVRVGDLVLYQMPFAKYDMGVKRVIGMPGDYVSVGTPGSDGEENMIQIPEGHCWVVGDNLIASRDSRTFGPLPLALIQGKVVAKVLPWGERHWLENPLQRVEH